MKIRPLGIEGAFEITPTQHGDARGIFLEWYRGDHLAAELGHPLHLAQANMSVSALGAVRGLHVVEVPPGQAKYLTCARGAIMDVVVDVRTGSPTFGRWESRRLDDTDRTCLYLAEGLAHGFCALTDDAILAYLCSTVYAPERERTIHPLDPDIGVVWPTQQPLLSLRDSAAPSLAQAIEQGLLPDLATCRNYTDALAKDVDRRTG